MKTVRFTTVIGKDQVIRPPQGVQLTPGEAEVIVCWGTEAKRPSGAPEGTLDERLARAAAELGIADLPADLAENHDHYAHGSPKGIDRK